jgi:hypothetical protein
MEENILEPLAADLFENEQKAFTKCKLMGGVWNKN